MYMALFEQFMSIWIQLAYKLQCPYNLLEIFPFEL
jgi:hypothetical protein